MRKFDYSFLNNGLLPANFVNLTANISALKTMARKSTELFVFLFVYPDRTRYVNTKVGFAGYYQGSGVPERWTNGKGRSKGKGAPVPLVARAVEKGTSFMRKQQVIKKATKAAKDVTIEVMKKTVDEEIDKIMK